MRECQYMAKDLISTAAFWVACNIISSCIPGWLFDNGVHSANMVNHKSLIENQYLLLVGNLNTKCENRYG